MKIRNHRELLVDAMETVEEIEPTIEAIRNYFTRQDGREYSGKFEVNPYGYDSRIAWNTHLVVHDGKAIGFTDGPVRSVVND